LLLFSIPVFFLVQENAAADNSSAVEMVMDRFIVSPFRKIIRTSENPLQCAQSVPACQEPVNEAAIEFDDADFSTEGEVSV
jgi:hypothetical protein